MDHAAPRLRPLGIGDLLDETITLYRRNFLLFVSIGALLLLPLGVLQMVQQLLLLNLPTPWVGLAVAAPTGLLAAFGSVAMFLAMTYGVSEVYMGRRPSVGDCYSAGLRRFWATVGLFLLVGLAVGAMAITLLGIPLAIYFGVGWTLSGQALLLEGLRIRQAMGRSRRLLKGSWWRAAGILILLGIIQWVLQAFFSLPAVVLSLFLMTETSRLAQSLSTVVGGTLSMAAQIVGGPIWFFGLVLLYYDLRVRKEGFDLEMMAREVERPAEGTRLGR